MIAANNKTAELQDDGPRPLPLLAGVGAVLARFADAGPALDRLYAWFCAPIILALVYILPPFQAPDEASHFYRSVQISHGEVAPTLAYNTYRQGAGGTVDRSVHQLVDRYCGTPNWDCRLRTRPGAADLVERRAGREPGADLQVVAFSNTVVYLPLAHAIPGAAIAVARGLGASAVGALYAGRLANGMFAILVCWMALRLLRQKRAALLIFAIATLPMVITVLPTLSADSGVISCSFLLAALCLRLLDGETEGRWFWPLLVLAVLYASAAKLAYLPIAVLPFACALVAKAPWPVLVKALAAGILPVVILLAWSGVIHAFVFPISKDLRVDPAGQVAFVKQHPIEFLVVLAKSMIKQAPQIPVHLMGKYLSSWDVRTPRLLLKFCGVILAFSVLSSGSKRGGPLFRTFVALVIAAGATATFAFLYVQNSVVGGPQVQGYQGRYLIPLLPFLALVVPWIAWPRWMTELRMRLAVGLGGTLTVAVLTAGLALRTW